jgi:rhodanese-related sulfurtransferase/DNA-binding transcriptional ArsR family regulator
MARERSAGAKRKFKSAVYEALSEIPAALANKSRLELLELLAQRPRTVQDLADETALSVANASQHLQVLARCNLVSVRRRGRYAFYQATGDAVYRLLKAVHDLAEATSALAAARHDRVARPEGVTDLATARRLLAKTRTVLVDVRPPEEFDTAHLPGAVSVPLDSLKRGTVSLPQAKHYVVYCRGPYCLFADEAVAILEKRGLRATRLALGTIEWAAAGEPLEHAV